MWRLGDVCREGGKPPYLPTRENLMCLSWLDVEKERKQETCTSLSSLCSLFNFQTAHGMVLVMLRLRDVCREGGSPPYLPRSENWRVIAWVDGERDRKQKLTISTFLCSFQNRTILTRSLSNCSNCFLVHLLLFPCFGEMEGERRRKAWYFPKNLFHFASHCSLLVSMEGALHMFAHLFSLHLRATRD